MPLRNIQPEHYTALLEEKVASTCTLFAPFSAPEPTVVPSRPTGFRLRAEFRMWHEGDDLNYVMFDRAAPKDPVNITEFVIAEPLIQAAMPVLRQHLIPSTPLRHKLFQVEFLATLAGDMLISLIYHRKLDETWEVSAEQLRHDLLQELPDTLSGLSVVGRSRKQKLVIGSDFVRESLCVNGRHFSYQQIEQAFTQPNGKVNERMIEWACSQAAECSGDLLELYCGNGNFTLPLAQHFEQVIATEVSKSSVRAARQNIEDNGAGNIQLVRLSAEEVSAAMRGERVFRRLADLPQPLAAYDLRTLFVDPPRAGLDDETVQMAAGFESILYISCNPESLAANLVELCKTHRIESFALFDQFPYTHHMECGMRLQRQSKHPA